MWIMQGHNSPSPCLDLPDSVSIGRSDLEINIIYIH